MSADGRLFNENRILAEQVRGLKAELERKGHEVLQLRERAAAAREEGRRDGLEDAERSIILEISAIEAAYRTLTKSERFDADCAAVTSGMTAALAAIRALKEKQP